MKSNTTDGIAEYRYERKFLLREQDVAMATQLVMLHPAQFSEIYYERQIHNVYFDDMQMRHLRDNIAGVAKRTKHRVRWYETQDGDVIRNAQYEIKMKSGEVSKKYVYKLPTVDRKKLFAGDMRYIVSLLADAPLWVQEAALASGPTLYNSYKRCYFASADQGFRITIDKDIKAMRLQESFLGPEEAAMQQVSPVLELKYAASDDPRVDSISKSLPFRLSKSSKYVSGFQQIDTSII